MYDVGCGDGRILCAAAEQYGCRCVGIELDHALVLQARALAQAKVTGW